MLKVTIFLPRATWMVETAPASFNASSAPSLILLAMTVSRAFSSLGARNPCALVQDVQPLRW